MPLTSVTATAAAITAERAQPSCTGKMYSPIATICSTVLILPPLLAGMTPCRITQKRSAVTPTSRTRITPVTHHGSSPRAESVMRAEPVSALSAIGSAILPKSVIIPLRLASWPSSRSVIEATPKTKKATIRDNVPSATRNATKTGTSTSRSTVSPFGRLISLGGAGELLASELVNGLRLPGTAAFLVIDQTSHEVYVMRVRYPHSHEVTDGQPAMCDHLGSAVHLRCLVPGPAAIPLRRTVIPIGNDLLDEYLVGLADPICGSLIHQLVRKPCQLLDPAGYVFCGEL